MKPVMVELGDKGACANAICVDFPYNPDHVRRVKQVIGARFVTSPRKHWHVPLDMNTCRALRKAFGDAMDIGPVLWAWAREASREEAHLGKVAMEETATLTRLPKVLPALYRAIHVGPIGLTFKTEAQWAEALAAPGSYQTADVRFLADAKAPLNANQQSLGKTIEWIAAVWEAGVEEGSHLIVCNTAAIGGTWEPELVQWQEEVAGDVGVFACLGSREQREAIIDEFLACTKPVRWLIVNTQMVQWAKAATGQHLIYHSPDTKAGRAACRCEAGRSRKGSIRPHTHYADRYPDIAEHTWRTVCVDECHKASVRNDKSITHKAMDALHYTDKRCAMSGTPSKKKGADVWGTLHWLRPDVFTNKWRFAGAYFEIEDNGFGKKIGELLPEKEDEFFQALQPYLLRRTKKEVLKWVPDKLPVPVWCVMGDAQRKLYEAMMDEGTARLGETTISTTSILAEYTRLSQFAMATCEMRNGEVWPTEDSCKLQAMLDKMEEADFFDESSTEKQVVFCTSKRMIHVAADAIRARMPKGQSESVVIIKGGMATLIGTIKEAFNEGRIRVLCIVTSAGGVSLSLKGCTVAHFLDESWAPDEQEQAEDRLHGAGRGIQGEASTYYIYRTRDTIDEYRMETAAEKANAQKYIMDVRRQLLKEKV